jgi:hypothetical protein
MNTIQMHELTKHLLMEYCEGKPFKLSEYADKIIDRIIIRDGHCPCRPEDVPCPCPSHREEISKDGHCHCNLFVIDPQIEDAMDLRR